MSFPISELQGFLEDALRRHKVLGASLAVLVNGDVHEASSGFLNARAGVKVTSDSVFQIGSVGKLFNAALVMQLVDEGLLDLDQPVDQLIQQPICRSKADSGRITARHLLSHTSGIEGDFFPDDQSGGRTVESYVDAMRQLPMLHETGRFMTYCNSGYVAAGRLVEVLRGQRWQEAVMERICEPLGLQHALADSRETLRYRCAMGHVAPPSTEVSKTQQARMTYLPLGLAPAGSVLSMSAVDLVRFVKDLISDVQSPYGLSAELKRSMRASQIEMLPHSRKGFSDLGLGWFISLADGPDLVGHDGATAGQWSYMMACPQEQAVFVLLTNSPSTGLADELRGLFTKDFRKAPVVIDAGGPAPDLDLCRYVGVYESYSSRLEVSFKGGELELFAASREPGGGPSLRVPIRPVADDSFALNSDSPALQGGHLLFVGERKGVPEFARLGVRMARRLG